MQVESDLIKESKRRSDIISSKLTELVKKLGAKSKGKSTAEIEALARGLFERAPLDFIERTPAENLAQIVLDAQTCVAQKIETEEDVLIVPVESQQACFIALRDCPYIVNTIMECCRELDVRVLTLLHPIVSKDRQKLSLNYLVIEKIDKKIAQKLLTTMKNALSSLHPVTDDFPKMLEVCDRLSGEFHQNGNESADCREAGQFINWLTEGAFNFLGMVEFKLSKGKDVQPITPSRLGLCSGESIYTNTLLMELASDYKVAHLNKSLISVTGLLSSSPVHRRTRMTHVLITPRNERGEITTMFSIVGLFTSRALAQECSTIPLIRHKFQEVVKAEGFIENTHDYKSVANIIDSLPKDEALALDARSLRSIVTSVLDVGTSSETAISLWADPQSRGFSIMVVMLRERFDTTMREQIADYISQTFKNVPSSSEYHLDITNRPVVRLYYHVGCTSETLQAIDLKLLRLEVAARACSWKERLDKGLIALNLNGTAHILAVKYADAFPADYRALQSVDDCLQDILQIEKLSQELPLRIGLANFQATQSNKGTIVVYSLTEEFTISRVVPALENSGFDVINERAWQIHPEGGAVIYSSRFRVHTKSGSPIKPDAFSKLVAPALEMGLVSGRDNDPLNSLALEVDLDLRSIILLRSYSRFLWQISKFASRFSIIKALSSYPKLARRLWEMFDLKFNPSSKRVLSDRQSLFQAESATLLQELRDVNDITADRVIRSLRLLLENTVRTNYYRNTSSIALKFRSEQIEIMPQPRPKFEIFVNTPLVEGVHLRSGSVARGGIRWSDRPDDYRSEVLGLMKTQRVKNALIVPTGAKGGFIVKQIPADTKAVPQAVQDAYKDYIRSLLSITDNRISAKVAHPENVLCYDGEDPYFVVAADKGTATFSDIANGIAVNEFNFWLGDAFASGGSNGYDHKLYAITAKGAWECVKRHFRDAEFPFTDKPFTAIGIGDMSGDVFGNGLLLSENYKMIAAFNHKHIFIDPNPDTKISFKERKRLFDLKGSQWSDYDAKLISKGGKIYNRFEREIKLSKEARNALGITQNAPEVLNGDELVHAILMAPVDLIWNGGIGTYVKANSQSHADVGDSANDAVRVNADELRAKVIGEGGNLGFTQLGRIEFARMGGRLNTDAIDNSGGVDLSDHEVNLKILFSDLLRSKKVTLTERNKILKDMSSEVCELVLEHNRAQSLLLSLAEKRSTKRLHYFQALLRELVRLGYVNRTLDALPDDDELISREREGASLTRPELAVCIATVKMWFKDALLSTDLTNNDLLDSMLLEYFPTAIRKRFAKEALKHPLRANILATQAANILVDCIGITGFHRLSSRHGVSTARAIECALAAELMLNTRAARLELMRADENLGSKTYLSISQSIGLALFDLTSWMLSRYAGSVTLNEFVKLFSKGWEEFSKKASTILGDEASSRFRERYKSYKDLGLSNECSQLVAISTEIVSVFEMLKTAQSTKQTLVAVAPMYSEVTKALAIDALMAIGQSMEAKSRWDVELLTTSMEDLRSGVSQIVGKLMSNKISVAAVVTELNKVVALDKWRANIEELKTRNAEVASLAVLSRQMQSFTTIF